MVVSLVSAGVVASAGPAQAGQLPMLMAPGVVLTSTAQSAAAGHEQYGSAALTTVPSAGITVRPVYYVFSLPGTGVLSTGCGPQARFVKVVGRKFYEFQDWGCDRFVDRGKFKGARVRMVGKEVSCSSPGVVQRRPSSFKTNGRPQHLRIRGVKRLLGPTKSLAALDEWYARKASKHPNLSGGPIPETAVTRGFSAAKSSGWIAYTC